MQTKTAPTQSFQTLQAQQHQAKLKKAHSDIKNAYHAGLFCGGMTLIATLAAMKNSEFADKTGLNVFALLDVFLIFGLTYGISRANRLAAKLMLGYFLLSKMIQLSSGLFNVGTMFSGVLLIYCFYLGVIGTSALYDLQERENEFNQGDFQYSSNTYSHVNEHDEVDDSAAPVPKAVSKFWISDELVELCRGDRSQAEWLIHQLRVKHPSQDMDWYNEQAIKQLNNPKTA
jgi:hypothetical protein